MRTEVVSVTPEKIVAAIRQATLDVLETMFFATVESDHGGVAQFQNGAIAAQLNFMGPLAGPFRVLIDRPVAESLAEAMLCLEPSELNDQHADQVAQELANMICGNLLSHLEPEAHLTLGSPATSSEFSPIEGATQRVFQLPEGMLAVEFRLDSVEIASDP